MALANLLPGYRQVEVFTQRHTSTTRWLHVGQSRSIVVKAATPESDADTHAQVRYEHGILQLLAERCDGSVIKPLDCQQKDGWTVLILEDAGATDLLRARPAAGWSLPEILRLGVRVAQALAQVHQARVIHKDINPSNIVINRDTGLVQLIDFGISTRLLRDWQRADSLRTLAGTLPYVSPEQTGRINRAIDYRTDFYALGATLYELIAQRPPFALSNDLMEVVHAIISKQPPLLEEVAPQTPAMVASVIRKMMAKSVDERYQSAYGLAEDLDRCAQNLRLGGASQAFSLGQADRSERFEIPQKLYGRDAARRILQHTYNATVAAKARRLVLIGGASGVGKSSLVQELQPAALQTRALMLTGKFDPMRRHVPLDAFVEAVTAFVKRLLRDDAAAQAPWRAAIGQHLGMLGHPLIELIPALETLLGAQPAVPALPPQETRERLQHALAALIRGLSQHQPLILFLDDMQWADATTHEFLATVLARDVGITPVLILAAYRNDNTVEHGVLDPLLTLAQADDATTVPLGPLEKQDVRALLADMLHTDQADPLADLVHAKTGGNAFFVGEVLKLLWNNEWIAFDSRAGRWTWDLRAVQTMPATDNVAQFMTERLRDFSGDIQHMLCAAACWGDAFSLGQIAEATPFTPMAAAQALWPLAQAGTLVPLDVGHLYAEGAPHARLRFAHDRVREASYQLLSAQDMGALHLRIARCLMVQHPDPQGDALFAILLHYQDSAALEPAEKPRLARLLLRGAEEAQRASAYSAARRYLERALPLLAGEQPVDTTQLGDVELRLADCEYLTGDAEQSEARLNRLLAQTPDPLVRAQYQRRQLITRMRPDNAAQLVQQTLDALQSLGIRLAPKPSIPTVIRILLRMRRALKRMPDITALGTMPEISDRRAAVQMELLCVLAMLSYHLSHSEELTFVVSAHMLLLTIQYGQSSATAFACFMCSLTLVATRGGDIDMGKALSAVTTRLLQERACLWPAVAMLGVICLQSHLTATPGDIANLETQGFMLGLAAGDFMGMGMLTGLSAGMRIHSPLSLYGAFRDARLPLITSHAEATRCVIITDQAVKCLLGQTESPSSFTDAHVSEKDITASTGSMEYASYLITKLQCLIIHRDFDRALQLIGDCNESPLKRLRSVSFGALKATFFCLAITQDALQAPGRPVRLRHKLRRERRVLRWFVQQGGEPAYGGIQTLIDAHMAAIDNNLGAALRLFEAALPKLESAGFLDYTALGYENAGRYCLQQGLAWAGERYLAQARVLYSTWGATVKVAALDAEFAFLHSVSNRRTAPLSHTDTGSHRDLDWQVVVSATQAISMERRSDKVVERLLDALLTCAGADFGVLFLRRGDEFVQHGGPALHAAPPERLLAYVERTREVVILNAGDGSGMWAEPYLKMRQPKAVLVAPIIYQGAFGGAVYLENSALTHAFSTGRIEAVHLMAAQAAISLESAQLYTELEQRVAERTDALRTAQAEVVRLERTHTEVQMAGGFAHEMRNALFAAEVMLSDVLGLGAGETQPFQHIIDHAVQRCRETATQLPAAQAAVQSTALAEITQASQEVQHLMQLIRRSTERAMNITTKILDYAELSRKPPTATSTSTTDVLASCLRKFQDALQKQHIHIEQHSDGNNDHVVLQAPHLSMIIDNLLSNARDAVQTSASPRRIVIDVRRVDQTVQIAVRDSGAGVDAAVRNRLFLPFVSTKGAAGTGLGLAMTRKVVEMYAGRIEVDSRTGEGTEFTVFLPAASPMRAD